MLPEGYIENYEQIAKDYKGIVSTETMQISSLIDASLCEMNVPFGHKVIDVGCGSGYTAGYLFSNNKFCVDASYNQCKFASVFRSIKGVIQADAQSLPIKNESFDVAICTDLFEHVPDEKKLVGEISRILRRGGILFFACPFEQDLRYYDSPEYEKKYRYVHLRSVSGELLERRFSKFHLLHETMITSHMAEQKSPYPIIFQVYTKRR